MTRPAPLLPLLGLALATAAVAGCGSSSGSDDSLAEGVFAPLGEIAPGATDAQRNTFERGLDVALHRFDLSEGLGPAFNVTFCVACHERPATGGSAGLYRNFFLSGVKQPGGPFFPGESAGMAGGVIRLYRYEAGEIARPPVPAETNVVAQRNPIPFFGVGLLAELSDDEILRRADPDDEDGDGISGRANFDRGFVGRFGRKSQTVSIEGFIRGPLFNHMGITTDPLTEAQRAELPVDSSSDGASAAASWLGLQLAGFAQAAAPDGPTVDDDGVPDPEMSGEELFDLVSMAMLMAAPEAEPLTPQTRRGRDAFGRIGCEGCHTPRLRGPRGLLPVYSDLLLHDMGPELADGIEQGEAAGSEFRSQPLWGLAPIGPYLHDGRAATLDAAIRMHGGEARAARDAYVALDPDEQADLEEFLRSLGGRSQTSPGLIVPGSPTPPAGEYGGPLPGLSPDELARFEAGRALFDREFSLAEGVGAPRFNGDSCRACHFEPVIGGAGARGVNVMRHGLLDGDDFVAPGVGTILHRETRTTNGDPLRAQADATIFEHRQTPHTLGLGLMESIFEAEILAHVDPDDEDEDGVSGRASITSGSRLGRFGWKAQVPSLAEFVRDAAAAELGMTLPAQPGLSFGATADADDVADPELSVADAEALEDFLALAAPPPRQPSPFPALAAAGEGVFDAVGCASCHIPSLEGALGPVHLYSDVLLHDILPEDALGIVDTSAGMREFRTAPLWGVSRTAPYLHDGRADTLEDAILLHDGEAVGAREAYLAAGSADQEALLRFLETL